MPNRAPSSRQKHVAGDQRSQNTSDDVDRVRLSRQARVVL